MEAAAATGAALNRIRLDDPRRESWPYRQGQADFHRNIDCPFAAGTSAAALWASGWQEEQEAERSADEAEEARAARYFDEVA